MRVYERQVKTTDRVEIVELSKCIAVRADIKSKLKNSNFFISYIDAGNWNKNPYELINIGKKYSYFSNEFWKVANSRGLSSNTLWDLFPNCIVDPMDAINLPDFSEDKIVWFDIESHMLYNIDATNPISMPYRKDYISGITNENYDLRKAKKILSANPNVLWVDEIKIPHYNAEPNKDAALEFIVKLPQETHDLLCNYFRDTIKDKFWTVRVRDALVWRPWLENKHGVDLDILGLKECYVEKEYKDEQD